ncbi:MAG: SDR family NAD(P)-dependent oxidoreductase [Flammeovirgaceae bacterium]
MKKRKAVFITGATSGIGKAIAEHLSGLGYLVFAGVFNANDTSLQTDGEMANIRAVNINVTQTKSIIDARNVIETLLPDQYDFVLVNNAGVAFGAPIEAESIEKIRMQMDVNYFGVIEVIRVFLPLLRQRRGQIINISSISGKSSMPFNGAYCASKYAVEALADALRIELRPWRINVSNVLPGDINTNIWQKALIDLDESTKKWSDEMMRLYHPSIDFMKGEIKKINGSRPQLIAEKVAALIASKRPPARVYAGNKVWFYFFLEKLPTHLRDYLIIKQLPRFWQT